MIIFYHGSDGYRLNQAVKDLAKQYKEKYQYGLSASFIDAAESGATEELENSLKLNSLFNEVGLVVLSNILGSSVVSERIAKMLDKQKIHDRKDLVVVLVGDGVFTKTKHKSFTKIITDKRTKTQEFKPLSGSSLTGWLKDEFEKRGCSADPMAIQEILELASDDSWNLIQEVEKLSNYSDKVGIKEVKATVADQRNVGPFELIDALGTRNSALALSLLNTELAQGRDPYNILGALISYFRSLLIVRDALEQKMSLPEIATASGLHPFVVRKAASSIRLFRPTEINQMFNRLANLDRSVKDGKRILTDELFAFLMCLGSIAN